VRMSLPFYRENGWDPVVLAVGEPWQEGVREPELLGTLPADVPIIYIRALPPRWSRWFGIGNLGLRSLIFYLWHGTRLLRRGNFDLVFFSTTQFITLSLGPLWRRWLGVPYVVDVQDPWRTDYYERPGSRQPPGGWKYQFARLQAFVFEGRTFRDAGAIMSVSQSYLDDLAARYPRIAGTPAAVIRFGASRGDIPRALALAQTPYVYPRGEGQVHFLYTGASGPVMPHALTVLFTALRLYQERKPVEARRLKFHFIGTSYVAPGRGKPSVLPVAALCDVASYVDEIPHRIGHLESIRLQLEADVLLLPGSSDLAYSPSKIYPYYLSGRPMLGLVFRDSVMEHLLEELSCAHLARFRQSEPKDQAYGELHAFFDLALAGFPPGSLPTRRDDYFREHYLAEALTRQQCDLFGRAVGSAAPSA